MFDFVLLFCLLKKVCCLALRNSISRCRHLNDKLLELRIEDILRPLMNQNDPICFEEIKALLRDLNCQLEYKELWTGTGKDLAH